MRHLPLADPGTADHRSPGRYLWWLMKGQWHTLLGGMLFGIIWMVCQAVMPAVIGHAIDDGIAAKDTSSLVQWTLAMTAIGILQAVSGIIRHRFAVTNWLTAAYRTVQLVARQATHLGATLPKRVATGEVVAIGTNDLAHLGNAMDVTARAAGAVVSFLVVAAILLNASVTLGLVVLIGVPVLLLLIGPLLKPLQRRNMAQREMMGQLSNLATDIVSGLRILRGIGGERVFHERYVRDSQKVRLAGVKVGRLQSLLDAFQVLLPGVFVVVVVWIGARFAVQGRISAGELVAFYGYAAFLMIPLRTATEFANKWIRAFVAARRVVRVLSLEPEVTDPDQSYPEPPVGAELVDVESGLRVDPGVVTALVSDRPEETARIADRLGHYAPGEVRWGDVPLAGLPRDVVRRRIVVSDPDSTLFSGTLREALDIRDRGDGDLLAALHTASAEDVLEALAEGLDAPVTERGRSFSGGQRQRLVLTRVLAADPEVLVLVEPTSAVDAHTEARIASRLRQHRAGRTTVVTTTSPLLLDRVDRVAFVRDGAVVAVGRHRDLLRDLPGYRAVVTREIGEEVSHP
ncbi:MAG TPA: ABC transporter ATP-binding protein [Nocardioides sp.]|uniref:ABC transporter ATP-binding protein n=1 Tax=Nocardioides sp. TaxID=35761 RepID=UPI002D7E40B1|nr:ABC transporter ATP-binding protein [Nocardioides sp.]HET6652497.1 ABC transporter ATP-binding protein [Nocardioides sp.]